MTDQRQIWAATGRTASRPGDHPQYAAVVDLPTITAENLALVAIGAVVLAFAIAVGAHLRLSRMQRRNRVLSPVGEDDVIALVSHQADQIAQLRGDVDWLRAELIRSTGAIEQSLQHVAVVRYDAFGDMGGRLSFSAAIIDDRGDGLVISSIHARGGSRTYAKGLVEGDSEVTLTPEEQQALVAARTGNGGR